MLYNCYTASGVQIWDPHCIFYRRARPSKCLISGILKTRCSVFKHKYSITKPISIKDAWTIFCVWNRHVWISDTSENWTVLCCLKSMLVCVSDIYWTCLGTQGWSNLSPKGVNGGRTADFGHHGVNVNKWLQWHHGSWMSIQPPTPLGLLWYHWASFDTIGPLNHSKGSRIQ